MFLETLLLPEKIFYFGAWIFFVLLLRFFICERAASVQKTLKVAARTLLARHFSISSAARLFVLLSATRKHQITIHLTCPPFSLPNPFLSKETSRSQPKQRSMQHIGDQSACSWRRLFICGRLSRFWVRRSDNWSTLNYTPCSAAAETLLTHIYTGY